MSKQLKWVGGVTSALLLVLLLLQALRIAPLATLPNELTPFLPRLEVGGMAETILVNYLFWGAIVFAVLVLCILLVLIFLPRTYTEVDLENGEAGTLLLKKSALEGFVTSLVKTSGYMKEPSVHVKLYKKKFKVEVMGSIIPRVEVVDKTLLLERQIKEGLQQFFGITKSVDFSVKVKNIEKPTRATSSRVD